MKVLYLVNIPSPYRVDFFNELSQYCDLTVLYERNQALGREWIVQQNNSFHEIYLKGFKIGEDSAICLEVIKYLKEKTYDLIVVGGYGTLTGMLAIEFLRLRKIPFVLNCDGGTEKQANFLKKRMKKHFISSASFYLSPAKITDEYLKRYGANCNRIYRYPFTSVYNKYVLNTVTETKKKLKLREELGLSNKFILISVGRILYLKGYDILIHACQNLSEQVDAYIVGGNPNTELVKLLNEKKISNVHFIEFQEQDILQKYYQASDAFVFSTRGDVWGLVVNEAMANGLPIISSDKAVASLELVRENGFLYSVEDSDELRGIIQYFLDNPQMCVSMGEKSLEIIKEYTIEKMAKKHYGIFREILRKGGGV